MTVRQITTILKEYQKKNRQHKKRDYLRLFEKKMLYRTTKTENPETTMGMIEKVIKRLSAKVS